MGIFIELVAATEEIHESIGSNWVLSQSLYLNRKDRSQKQRVIQM